MDTELALIELFHQINRRLLLVMLPLVKSKQLSIAEMSVLMRLSKSGSCRVTELAAMIGIPASTVTGILDRLETQGFISRNPDPDDRRGVLVTATGKLAEFRSVFMSPLKAVLKSALGKIPETRVRRLVGDLQFVLDKLENSECSEGKEAGKP